MGYFEFLPHIALQQYIDAYWVAENNGTHTVVDRILPDGCVDIIMNLGTDYHTESGKLVMRHEGVYLVGTMTVYKETCAKPDTKLVGIRFKPGAFSLFHNFAPLHEVTNNTIEFEKKHSPLLKAATLSVKEELDGYFLKRLPEERHAILPVIVDVQNSKGQASVYNLQKKHYISARQLERGFKQHVGISPKAYINFVRYQNALASIQNNNNKRSLADVAYEHGYYDHAHLLKEVKKYSGLTPSAF